MTEKTTMLGKCHDCAQGVGFPAHTGFALYRTDGEDLFWYCRYCGSNHVSILDAEGNTVLEQGDLYNVD